MRKLIVPAVFSMLSCLSVASHAGILLVAPAGAVTAGKNATLTLLVTNDGAQPMTYTVPAVIPVRLSAGQTTLNASLAAGFAVPEQPVRMPPQSFRKFEYTGPLPTGLYGTVTVEVPGIADNKALIALDEAAAPATAAVPANPVKTGGATIADDYQQRVTQAASAYEPVYFDIGTRDRTNAKFQISFKYRLATPDAGTAPKLYERIYFGYTQTSLWDLQGNSKPFEDSIYKPSLFYYNDNLYSSADNRQGYGVETGLGHESNGKGGLDSRSMDIAYVRPFVRLGDALDWHWTVAPKLYTYLDKSENPDIAHYRGYADVLLKFGRPRGWEFSALLRKGTRGSYGSLDASASYPLESLPFSNLNGYIVLDYFNGYGEDLINYNRRLTPQLRLGLMIVR